MNESKQYKKLQNYQRLQNHKLLQECLITMRDSFFRKLDPEEEEKFREWARENWLPDKECNELWHPVVRDEWEKITEDYKSIDKW